MEIPSWRQKAMWAWAAISFLSLWSVGIPMCRADLDESTQKFEEQLRIQGLDAESARKVAGAMAKAEESENSAPLWPLMEDQSVLVALTAAAAAITSDEGASTTRAIKLLRQGKGSAPALIFALSFSYRREAVKYLVDELKAARTPERAEAALFSLRVMTGHTFEKPAEWAAWWKVHGAKLTLTPPKDEAEQERRIRASMAVLTAGKLRTALAPIFKEDKSGKPGASELEEALGGIFKLMEHGGNLQLSEAAIEGDRAFARGRIADAEAAYGQASAADARDLRSAFLRACTLFELGKRGEAATAFQKIAEAEPKAVAAALMVRLCQRPADQKLLPAAREELAMMKLPEDEGIGWGDPILYTLLGQQMAAGGPLSIPQEPMDKLAEDSAGDVEVLCGIAILRRREGILPTLTRAREKFPRSVLAVSTWVAVTGDTWVKTSMAERIAALKLWIELEPRNGVPALALLDLENPKDRAIKSPTLQPYSEPALAAVKAAAVLPFVDHHDELHRAIRKVRESTGYPFAVIEINSRTSVGNALANVMMRLSDTENARRTAGDEAGAEEIATTIDLLAGKARALKVNEITRVLIRSSEAMSVSRRKKDLAAANAPAERIAALETRLQESKPIREKPINLREINFQMLPLPSIQREIVDEVLAGTRTPGGIVTPK